MRSLLAALAAPLALSMLAPSTAQAVFIQGNGAASTENLGRFTGQVTYTANTMTTGTLSISLTNTNTPIEGGFITGVVFNIPGSDALASATLATTAHSGFLDLGSESAAPFGTYDAGAALGGAWLGGGSPNGGIAAGTTGTMTFTVSAADASSLMAEQFVGASTMVVRFKGFANGGSDKVPVQLIPAPGAVALAGMGGLLLVRRRRK
ncbi:MAG TPA: hypothetical protein PKE29_14995 [Phycisphaerales bacterium]|nr:hypothetical protein [Phycisphaerales bacterium]